MIVINMEMPSNCVDCPLTFESFDGSTTCCLGVKDIDWNKRPNDCPIKQEILTINDETKN